MDTLDLKVNDSLGEHAMEHTLEFIQVHFFAVTMLVEYVLGGGLRAVHDLPHPLDDLSCVDWCELLDELIIGDISILVIIQVLEELFDFLVDKAHCEASQFKLEFLSGQPVVRVWVYDVEKDGESHVILNQIFFNLSPGLK